VSDYGLAVSNTKSPSYEKDASDVVDYSMSWHHLGTDTILTSVWESDGLTIGTNTFDGLVTNVFVSGGTSGAIHSLTNTVTTGMSRTLQRTVYISVNEL
jgi:hypothetical protein